MMWLLPSSITLVGCCVVSIFQLINLSELISSWWCPVFCFFFTFFFLLLNFGILDHSLGLQRKKKWMFVVFFLDSCFIKYFSWKRWWKLLDYWLICGFSSFWISLMIPLCYQEVIQYSVSYCYIILRCHLKLLLLIFLWGFRSARENFLTI